MIRFLKAIVLAFKPTSDAEAVRMNLNGPRPPEKKSEVDPDLEMASDGSFHLTRGGFWRRMSGSDHL